MIDLRDGDALWDFIEQSYRAPGDRLFRMEQLPVYNVPHQSADLDAWFAGDQPNWAAKREWWKVLAADRAAGKRQSRVRIFSEHLTDDELMSCHWGYPYIGQWEDVRVLRRGEHAIPNLLNQDYWIVADQQVVLMHYSVAGAFERGEVLDQSRLGEFMDDRDAAWDAAEPFTTWWERHSELHDARRTAA